MFLNSTISGVNHQTAFVNRANHINGIENFSYNGIPKAHFVPQRMRMAV